MNFKNIWVLFLLITTVACSKDADVVVIDGDAMEVPGDETTEDAITAEKVILEMGPGFNLGNTFDNNLNSSNFADTKPILDFYYAAGMKHIRIPVTWMEGFSDNLADANGNVDYQHPRFLELVKLIDHAISLEMYVVVNTHHEHWLKDHYDGSDAFNDKFDRLWTGIAEYFKGYPDKLIFEVLNEPEGNLGEWDGSGGWPDPVNPTQLNYTRQIMEVGYQAIRATGDNNLTRTIMVSVNGQGNQNMFDDVYPSKTSLPGDGNDKHIAIQVHSYDPWSFCGQTGSNSAYPGDGAITGPIDAVAAHAASLGVPVNYGEFGVGRDGNATERNTEMVRNYYRLLARTVLGHKMSYSVWDDRGWFGLISGPAPNYTFTYGIVPFMLAN